MRYTFLCVALVATSIFFTPAKGSPLDDKVAALKKAINEEVAAKPKTTSDTPPSRAYANASYIAANLDQLTAQIDDPNTGRNVETEIGQILAAYSSEAVQKAGQELIVEIRLERKARTDAATAEIQALLKRVSDEVAKAKKPEELDGLLVDLQKFQDARNGGYSAKNQALYQQVSGAFEFTKLWQNYLSHLANGESELVKSDLQNLSQNNYGVGIIPRSYILELLAPSKPVSKNGASAANAGPPLSQVENILKGVKTLDDIETALHQLAPLEQTDQLARDAYNNLAPIAEAYNSVKEGLPTNINITFTGYANGPNVDARLHAQLLIFLLQHYFDTYKGTPPAPGEKPPTFVNRVKADAVSREDWSLLQKALGVQAYLNRDLALSPYADNNGTASISGLIVATNQEAAHQYALAVVSYENALKIADIEIPAKLIGDKLAAIQKEHPKEYEDGMQMVISPPVRRYSTYPGMVPSMSYRPDMPSVPGYSTNQPSPMLSIPGTTTKQAAAAAPSTSSPVTSASTNQPLVMSTPPSTNAPAAK